MWNKIQKIYVGTQQVRPYKFTPTSSTLAYYPFVDNQIDQTWNTTLSATGTKQAIGYQFTTSGSNISINTPSGWTFFSFWTKVTSMTSSAANASPFTKWWTMRFFYKHLATPAYAKTFAFWTNNNTIVTSNAVTFNTDTWYHFAYWSDSSNHVKAWINWQLIWDTTVSGRRNIFDGAIMQWEYTTQTFSDLILENRLWTANEVSNYYNHTKSNYWL